MAIYRLLQNAALGPEEIDRLVTAYEKTLKALELSDRSDPITRMVARKIIELGQTGVRDPHQLTQLALRDLGKAHDEVRFPSAQLPGSNNDAIRVEWNVSDPAKDLR